MARPALHRTIALLIGLSLVLLGGVYRSNRRFWSMASRTRDTPSAFVLPTTLDTPPPTGGDEEEVEKQKHPILFLKSSNASTILEQQQRGPHKHSIDVLIVGSKNNIDQPRAQRETWASHGAVRHFFLSTEDDDVDPMCRQPQNETERWDFVVDHVGFCKGTGKRRSYWRRNGLQSNLTNGLVRSYARTQWLQRKKNPKGWVCAQRRFLTSLTELLEMYAAASNHNAALPDYLILADDDTYVNIETIIQLLMEGPANLQAAGKDLEAMVYPPLSLPVVTAGCRVEGSYSSPFGGYGTFFSRGSLEKLIQPLLCSEEATHHSNTSHSSSSSFEEGSCQKLLHKKKHKYPMGVSLGEEAFFEVGNSLNQVFYKYTREVEHFCLHSDQMVGYMANFYNFSRHTTNASGSVYDELHGANQEYRLHQLPNSWCNRTKRFGNCLHAGPSTCGPNATVCHYMDSASFRNLSATTAINNSKHGT